MFDIYNFFFAFMPAYTVTSATSNAALLFFKLYGQLCVFAWVLYLLGSYFYYFKKENYHVHCFM